MVPRIQTQTELIDYVKRQLGFPVVNLEITPEQFDDCISDAVQKFVEIAYGGTQMRLYVLNVTAGVNEYIMPYEILSVLKIYETSVVESHDAKDIFSTKNILAKDFMKSGFYRADLLTYTMVNQFIETLDLLFNPKVTFDFNNVTKNLYLNEKPKDDYQVGVIVYEMIDKDSIDGSNIFDNRWVKKYATELTRRQWAYNLLKYSGSVLPQGLQMNVDGILAEAKENIAALDEDLLAFEAPPDFYIG